MPKPLVPDQLKTHILEEFIESLTEPANTSYYAFIGDHISSGDTLEDVPEPSAGHFDISVQTFRDMIIAKKLYEDDITLAIRRNEWVANTVYAMYDDRDNELHEKDFFVVVDETAFKHVYKCLYNANNSPSTIRPTFADVDYDPDLFEVGDNYYETADGYQWKYLYSLDSTTFDKFSTQKFMPVVANTTVQQNAINGSIDVIKVDNPGKNYNNFLTGCEFKQGDLTVGNTTTIRVSSADQPVSSVANFYKNTILNITSGPGAGQYRRVVSSFANNDGVMIVFDSMEESSPDILLNAPEIGSTFEISPEVRIVSTGQQTINAYARAIVSETASNSISKVEMLNIGRDYQYAIATVSKPFVSSSGGGSAGQTDDLTVAEVRPILPPSGGHGSDVALELGSKSLIFHAEFDKSESGTVAPENTFATFGILRNPLFANLEITHTKLSSNSPGSDNNFIDGEKVYQFKKVKLNGNVSVTLDNTTVVSNDENTSYDEFFQQGDFVYITSDQDNRHNFLSTVESVSNSSTFNVKEELNFASINSELYVAKVIAEGVVKDSSSSIGGTLYLKDAEDKFQIGYPIISANTYSIANVVGIDVNDRIGEGAQYNFSTVNQMTRCFGEITGEFNNDEIVFQGEEYQNSNGDITATAIARVHSSNSSSISLTRVSGELSTNTIIKGLTSQSILGEDSGSVRFTKYEGDLDPNKGDIIYIQTDVPVTRTGSQTEEIRVILEF